MERKHRLKKTLKQLEIIEAQYNIALTNLALKELKNQLRLRCEAQKLARKRKVDYVNE